MATSIAALLLLVASDLALAQTIKLDRKQIQSNDIQTIRVYTHHVNPPLPIMEIFLKDQNQPGFILTGEPGKILEQFYYMNELANMWSSRGVTVLYEKHNTRWETNDPYFMGKKYGKAMHPIRGFYYDKWHTGGGPSGLGSQPSTEMVPAQPITMTHDGPPTDDAMRGRMMHDQPPTDDAMRGRMMDDGPPPSEQR
jgi:hypothetical protein